MNRQNELNSTSCVIPRPITKRQHSSPANCGVARINLSDAVAKITNGPKSCTNPFLNGSLSITEDTTNSNDMPNNQNRIECKNQHQNENNSNRMNVSENQNENQNENENPFMRRRRNDGISHFSFPSNGNIDDNNDEKNQMKTTVDSINKLIELDECTSTCEQPNNLQQIRQIYNRSLSSVETVNLHKIQSSTIGEQTHENIIVNPFYAGNNLHKTLSDTYLEQYSSNLDDGNCSNNTNQTHTFCRTLSRQSIPNSCSNSTNSINISEMDLKRALSCDSVNSESSVLVGDLEQQHCQTPTVTGQLCVGFQHDK